MNEAICGNSREGISCTSCAPGYTIHFYSPTFECKHIMNITPCKLHGGLYIHPLRADTSYSGFHFSPSFQHQLHIRCDQRVHSFQSDACTYFFNIGFITPSSVPASLLKLHQSIYGLFNLGFFYAEYLSFCLLAELDMLAFKYITTVYILILMMLVIWYMNKCHRGMKCLAKFCTFNAIKASIIHDILAFFILSYSVS